MIEVQHPHALSASLSITVGDLLVFRATGGHIHAGAEAVELLGPFIPGILGENGAIVSPMGPPNSVLFLARRPGQATVDVVTGDPWYSPKRTTLNIVVEP